MLFLLGLLLATEIELKEDDTRITQSVSVKPLVYRISDSNENGIIHIRGDNLVIDFQGATLEGHLKSGLMPSMFFGIGVFAQNCKNLTIKNLNVRGVRVGIYLKNCESVVLENCDVSDNYRQKLKSTPQKEDESDWLFGHQNDANEWLRYGAGIYVEDCKAVTVRNCRARNGQNGICLVRVNDSWIYDNDMSFLSGWGLAMWRSSRNEISHNRFDWCLRGFSYGVYQRGQDSAGILVYEQCNDNVIAFNSATHSGDGFFLYAGNETLEKTGEGGCNRNLIYKNDFSFAVANGIEATFSQGNMFIDNLLEDCEHGIWAGYSYDSLILRNTIRNCVNGISIEYGHGNQIVGNRFERAKNGIRIWGNDVDTFQGKPFSRKNDTHSRDYRIVSNQFVGGQTAIFLRLSSNILIHDNRIGAPLGLLLDERCVDVTLGKWEGEIKGAQPQQILEVLLPDFEKFWKTPKLRGTANPFSKPGEPRGRRHMAVDEWGPYVKKAE